MLTLTEIEERNEISEKEFAQMSGLVFSFVSEKQPIKDISAIETKDNFINTFLSVLRKYLDILPANDRGKRLEVINFIDKLNFKLELNELQKRGLYLTDIEKAASGLGRKAQSAFETK